jgi:hypothetical protein
MAHSGHELWPYPVSIGESQFRNRATFELSHLQTGTQLSSFNAGEGDEGQARISQSLCISLSKQCQWSFGFAIPGSADDDERAFSEAFLS